MIKLKSVSTPDSDHRGFWGPKDLKKKLFQNRYEYQP